MVDSKVDVSPRRQLSNGSVTLVLAVVGILAAVIVGFFAHNWLKSMDQAEVNASNSQWGHSISCPDNVIDIVGTTPYPTYKVEVTCPGYPVRYVAVPETEAAFSSLNVWHNSQTGAVYVAGDIANGPGGESYNSSPTFGPDNLGVLGLTALGGFFGFFFGALIAYGILRMLKLVKLDD